MAFDKSLDKELFTKKIELSYGVLTVSVVSYNKGNPKLQLSRQTINKEENSMKWAKLGRLSKIEVEQLLPIITEAYKVMEK